MFNNFFFTRQRHILLGKYRGLVHRGSGPGRDSKKTQKPFWQTRFQRIREWHHRFSQLRPRNPLVPDGCWKSWFHRCGLWKSDLGRHWRCRPSRRPPLTIPYQTMTSNCLRQLQGWVYQSPESFGYFLQNPRQRQPPLRFLQLWHRWVGRDIYVCHRLGPLRNRDRLHLWLGCCKAFMYSLHFISLTQ